MKRPRGYTMVEMLAVIGVTSILLSAATMALFALMQNERAGRDHVLHTQSLTRLAERFRADAHATPPDKITLGVGKLIHFQPQPNRTVLYRQTDQRITRTEQTEGAADHVEVFVIPRGAVATASTEGGPDLLGRLLNQTAATEKPKVARLTVGPLVDALPVWSAGKYHEPTGAQLEIEARVGADHRFDGGPNP